MLDKVAGVLKKKRKNQKGTPLRVAHVYAFLFSQLSIILFAPLLLLLQFLLSFHGHALAKLLVGWLVEKIILFPKESRLVYVIREKE